MPTYRVILSGPTMQIGPWRAPSSWQSGAIDAPDHLAAESIARERCAATFDDDYAKGRATVVPLYRYALTVRGKRDKRRRETFVVMAADEREAVQALRYNDAACHFAGYGLFYESHRKINGKLTTTRDQRIVKVVRT